MTAQDQQIAATTPLALHAVARHLLDNDLQVESIAAPRACLGERSVIVHVPGDGDGYWSARWRDTLAVDGITTEPIGHPEVPAGVYERYVVHGRLPSSGVRVSVVTVRRAAPVVGRRGLVSVPDGGAA